MSIYAHIARSLRPNPEMESGWEIVCPDGRVRSYPFHNKGDAQAEAEEMTTYKCQLWPEPSPLELSQPPCPEGQHTVRPVEFSC